jgi:hypothetical protein
MYHNELELERRLEKYRMCPYSSSAMVVLLMHYLDFALVVTGKDAMHIMSSLLAFSIAIPGQDLQLGSGFGPDSDPAYSAVFM